MNKWKIAVFVIVSVIVIGLGIFFIGTPKGRTMWNNYEYSLQKADDATKYDTRKEVEDTCRAMISSYKSDRVVWEQFKDSENDEKLSWAEQAKMRANKTAITYNEYILKNSFVWEDNVPSDIDSTLEVIN
jgi:spermidine synthase